MQAYRDRFSAGQCLLAGLLAFCCGCDWLIYGGFLDPTVLGSFHGSDRTLEIRKSISLGDEPDGIQGATDPTPEDIVALVEEYRIGPQDQVVIRIMQLIAEDQETVLTRIVDNLGQIYLPAVGEWIRIEGMTVREAQLAIADLLRERQILVEPEVDIQVVARRQSTYTIHGAVQRPGLYEIVRPNFRLLEALNSAGGISETQDYIYVFRSTPEPEHRVEPGAALRTRPSGSQPAEDQQLEEKIKQGPSGPVALSGGFDGSGPPPETRRTRPAPQEESRAATSAASVPMGEPDKRELIDAISPTTGPITPQPESGPSEETGLSKWIWLNGEWVEIRQGPATAPGETMPAGPKAAQTQPEIDWDALVAEPHQRIIRVPAKALRDGDPRYNIVIRQGDIIRVPPGPVGEFFLGGTVARPGTYSLTGRKVTLKQAIVSAAGLNVFGWPERCEIIRRIGEDRETVIQLDLRKIFEYKEDDLYLKPNDIVMVGTHAITPFLATLRNSFRLSYGFGFVYDRNFADIDAFTPQSNPRTLRRFGQRGQNPLAGLFR